MSKPPAAKPGSVLRPKPPQSNPWPIIVAFGVFLVIALVAAGRNFFFGTPQPPAGQQAENAKGKAADESKAPVVEPLAETDEQKAEPPPSPVIDDDGKTLWVSPTEGKPLDLSWLSPGAQIIVSLRPAALLKMDDGDKVRAALGPVGQQAIDDIERMTAMTFVEMERLVVGCQIAADNNWSATIVVHATKPIASAAILAKQSGAVEKEHGGKKYWLAGERAYFFPGATGGALLVVAPEDAIKDVIDLAGQMPPLRRDIERLIDHTDGDRQVTIVLAPNSLFGGGQTIFSGQVSRLRNPLYWFLGDELSGAALSMNWDANFFLELIATPKLETSPETAARIFAERVAQIPQKLEEYVVGFTAQPYGRLVIARFPEMLRKMALYTRSAFDSEHAVLRCYLPAVAGHNLLLAAELTLAETPGAATVAEAPAAKAAASAAPAATVKEMLAKVTSLKFAKDTLESALEQLSQDVGAPIVIRGPDLQADGITKNQSFGIDLADKPAAEILVEILRLANPDKTATGPNDAKQKLVYIIEQKPDKTEQIVVTTRAKVKERKDELPEVFRVEE